MTEEQREGKFSHNFYFDNSFNKELFVRSNLKVRGNEKDI